MPVERLSADDLMMLRAGNPWPQHITALALLDGAPLLDENGAVGLSAARAAVESRLHLVPRFRQLLHTPGRGLGAPFWTDARAFDVRDHVLAVRIPYPGGEAELLATVEDLRRRPLELSRPLWDLWFLDGLADGSVALFVRIHHAIADGMAAMVAFGAFLDDAPGGAAPEMAPPWQPVRRPGTRELLLDNVRRHLASLAGSFDAARHPGTTGRAIRAALPGLRELLAEQPASLTTLNRLAGPDRRLAVIRTTDDLLGDVARAHHATPNDVLLAITAAGVRAVLEHRGELRDATTIRLYVPVSMRRGRIRRSGAAGRGNLISQMAVPVALRTSDPAARLHLITAETARRRHRKRVRLGQWFHAGPVTRLLLKLITRQRVNTTTAYLRGPGNRASAFGAEVLAVYPVIPLIGNVSLGVGAISYGGDIDIGITADRVTYPDLEVLVAGMRAELGALSRSAGTAAAPDRKVSDRSAA
ncbi:MAG TPA: wax ester/triacylglycerol synthase domain-containing protein [Candidatus Limnocylindrales bacterium]|nr:wax ester/triacylglycerol synthase domain-containing protein [Candidatus Limnocylindrales bacterium]